MNIPDVLSISLIPETSSSVCLFNSQPLPPYLTPVCPSIVFSKTQPHFFLNVFVSCKIINVLEFESQETTVPTATHLDAEKFVPS